MKTDINKDRAHHADLMRAGGLEGSFRLFPTCFSTTESCKVNGASIILPAAPLKMTTDSEPQHPHGCLSGVCVFEIARCLLDCERLDRQCLFSGLPLNTLVVFKVLMLERRPGDISMFIHIHPIFTV